MMTLPLKEEVIRKSHSKTGLNYAEVTKGNTRPKYEL